MSNKNQTRFLRQRFVSLLPLLLSTLFLEGCATIPRDKPLALKDQWQSYFKLCAPQDGAHSIQLFHEGNLVGAAELEWIARGDQDWEVDITNNLGQRLGRLVAYPPKATKNLNKSPPQDRIKLSSQSQLIKKLPPVEMEPDGFLVIDDYWIGMKAGELSCMLAGHLPVAWAKNLASASEKTGELHMEFEDDERTLTATVRGLPTTQQIQICATSEWRNFWVFKHALKWCAVKYKKSKAKMPQGSVLRGEYPHVRQIEVSVDSPSRYRLLLTPLESSPITKVEFRPGIPFSSTPKHPIISQRKKLQNIYE